MSYIDREALERKIHTGMTIIQAMQVIMDEPAADVVEVRHGRWIEDGDCQYCSECGEEHSWADYRAAYCDELRRQNGRSCGQ